jgi:hypothetical protein
MNSTYTTPSKRGRNARQLEVPNRTHSSLQAYTDEKLLKNTNAVRKGMIDFLRQGEGSEIPEDQIGEAAVSSTGMTN